MSIDLDQIQGNIFGGFNKDFQDFIFLRVKNADNAREWVRKNSGELVSTSRQVLAFNNAFKKLSKSGIKKPETVIQARWMNIAFSNAGLLALKFKDAPYGDLPKAFTEGMATRSIGDVGPSDPKQWTKPFNTDKDSLIHAVVLVAADTESDLNAHVAKIRNTKGFVEAFEILETLHGRTRVDEVGHEHFGFKDGVSQPGIRGLNMPDDPLANPDQGHPGQDLLWPGEFVLGYPKQIPTKKAGHDGPNPDPGKDSTAGNGKWTKNGSFLVFRRLEQDVPAFHEQLGTFAKEHGLSVDLAGAKIVGRYRSGCPLEALSMNPKAGLPSPTDPGLATPLLADSDALNNAFEYSKDAIGAIVPRAAHIRKAYPRDEITLAQQEDSESETQTHRLLRRGIPYGTSFGATVDSDPKTPRGLLFLAYQSDIERQFEFVQSQWVNKQKFPPFPIGKEAGEDPLIAQSPNGPFQLNPGEDPKTLSHFVKTTGGEYFFAPSLSTLLNF